MIAQGAEMSDRAARGENAGVAGRASMGSRIYDHLDVDVAAHASLSELRDVIERQRVAMVIFRPEDGEILLANPAAAELLGRPVDRIIGSRALDLVEPGFKFELAAKSLEVGAVDAYRARRRLRGREDDVLYLWVRAIDVDDRRLALAVAALGRDLAGLGGANWGSPFGAVVAVAIGVIDQKWKILSVSTDIKQITGLGAPEVRGQSLLDLLAPDVARRVLDLEQAGPTKPITLHPVELREPSDLAPDFCLLVAEPQPPEGRRLFALVGWPRHDPSAHTTRERELEARLRRIGAEVRAAGLIELLDDYPGIEPSGLGEELTTRQLEIVELLLRGVRVPTIARTLFISPSTVRNHLSRIYRHFGVHSQADLLEELRKAAANNN